MSNGERIIFLLGATLFTMIGAVLFELGRHPGLALVMGLFLALSGVAPWRDE